jgi:hypothetical protein
MEEVAQKRVNLEGSGVVVGEESNAQSFADYVGSFPAEQPACCLLGWSWQQAQLR